MKGLLGKPVASAKVSGRCSPPLLLAVCNRGLMAVVVVVAVVCQPVDAACKLLRMASLISFAV
ncbi:Uncharacterized protein APZ42_011056 [Daphnia magna]|uniref:Uncharacterized protein n=1 Tax=Daphnia magna TaxID=35525 RepID=A0A162T558_9CRUS|nr:Uncharacterized protein APZ42_011056 [Daphnia magna]